MPSNSEICLPLHPPCRDERYIPPHWVVFQLNSGMWPQVTHNKFLCRQRGAQRGCTWKGTWLLWLGTQEAIITQDSEKPGLNRTASPYLRCLPSLEAVPQTFCGHRLGHSFFCPFLTLGFRPITAALNAKKLETKTSTHSSQSRRLRL